MKYYSGMRNKYANGNWAVDNKSLLSVGTKILVQMRGCEYQAQHTSQRKHFFLGRTTIKYVSQVVYMMMGEALDHKTSLRYNHEPCSNKFK